MERNLREAYDALCYAVYKQGELDRLDEGSKHESFMREVTRNAWAMFGKTLAEAWTAEQLAMVHDAEGEWTLVQDENGIRLEHWKSKED